MAEVLAVAAATLSCGECGIVFSVPEWWKDERVRDHATWYCPNGHHRAFNGKTAEQRRIEELERTERWLRTDRDNQRAHREAAERSLRGTRGALTRVKNRVAAGTCPCCSHKFKDLKRHMVNQHPAWNPDAHAAAIVETASK